MSLKNFNDTIGNRTRDLPVCSVVPQTLSHRAPLVIFVLTYIDYWNIYWYRTFLSIHSYTALQPLVGPGLPQKVSPFFVSPIRGNFKIFSTQTFLRGDVVNSQPRGPGYPFSSGTSPFTCRGWETIPVAALPRHCSHDSLNT